MSALGSGAAAALAAVSGAAAAGPAPLQLHVKDPVPAASPWAEASGVCAGKRVGLRIEAGGDGALAVDGAVRRSAGLAKLARDLQGAAMFRATLQCDGNRVRVTIVSLDLDREGAARFSSRRAVIADSGEVVSYGDATAETGRAAYDILVGR